MPVTKQITLRLSNIQRGQVKKLADKLGIDQSNVIRLAIARLAEQEGITRPASR
jgi:antitoxin component of RelBE/YafQ-DinJ toxin-antitoxin module